MPAVPISDNTPREEFVAAAAQAIFFYTFFIADKTHLNVTQNGVTLIVDVDFTVTPTGILNDNGGQITLVVPALLNDSIVITRETPRERQTGFTTSGSYRSPAVNLEYTSLVAMVQELDVAIARSITLAPSITGITSLNITEAPVDGRALVWSGTSGDIRNSTVDVDTLAATVAADAAAAAASAASAATDAASAAADAAIAAAAAALYGLLDIGTASTTDATPTNVTNTTITSDTAGYMEIEVIGRQTGGIAGAIGDCATYKRTIKFSNIGGTTTVNPIHTAHDYTAQGDANWDIVIGTAGADVTVGVVGAVNKDINWEVFTRRRELA